MFSVGCLLLGHDDMVARNAGRMWLRCQHCGRDTPGWTVGPGPNPIHQPSPRDRGRASRFLTNARAPHVVSLTPHR